MDQTAPKCILVSAYQRFAGAIDVVKIVEYLSEIVDLAMTQNFNKLILGTCYFVPSHMSIWGAVSILNMEIHKLSDKMSMPRGNIHKHLMRTASTGNNRNNRNNIRMIRPSYFLEYQLGLSLGLTLSWEGLIKYKECVIRIFDFSFAANSYRPPSSPAKPDMPPLLEHTPGYMEDRFMRQVMEAKRFIQVQTPEDGVLDEPKLKCQDARDRPSGWRYWRIYKEQGPMWTFESREGMLEAWHMQMRQSHSDNDIYWGMKHQEEIDSSDASVEEIDDEVRQVTLSTGDDDVFMEDKREKQNEEQGEKQKERKNSNEKELLQDLNETRRLLSVEQEKSKSYRKESEKWKREAEKEKERNEELLKSLEKEEKSMKHLRKQNKRLVQEYYYLRDLYEARPRNLKVKRASADINKYMNESSDEDELSDGEEIEEQSEEQTEEQI